MERVFETAAHKPGCNKSFFDYNVSMNERKCDIAYVLVDWGTSSLRVWCVDQGFNTIVEDRASSGMHTLTPTQFEPTLETLLSNLNVARNIPVLICGMAGAKQGWMDAGYIDIPTKLDYLADHVCTVPTASGRDVRILPGLAQRDRENPDVMRGEETILLGAALANTAIQTFCIPGTHSKWVFVEEGRVAGFSTYMTGELFALISNHSTVSALISNTGKEFDETAFLASFNEAIEAPMHLTKSLFSLRAGPLLGNEDEAVKLSSKLSGMLVAAEIYSIKSNLTGSVCLIANGRHQRIYQLALQSVGLEFTVTDSEELVLSGLSHVASQLWRKS